MKEKKMSHECPDFCWSLTGIWWGGLCLQMGKEEYFRRRAELFLQILWWRGEACDAASVLPSHPDVGSYLLEADEF